MTESRLLEMISATMAREKCSSAEKIDQNLLEPLKHAIAAVFAVKLAFYSQMLPRSIAEDLREDLSALLAIAIGPEGLKSPSFRTLYDATAKDILEVLLGAAE